jgi:predicted phage-related endonuclease
MKGDGMTAQEMAQKSANEPHTKIIPQKIRASMAHKCTKCLVDYLLNGETPSGSGAALMGTIIHNGFIPYYEKIIGRRIVRREMEVENKLFKGHVDGIIKAEKKLFELKTVNGFKFQKIKEPLDEHLTQVNVYMHLTGLKKAHIVYLDRDSGEHKAFDIEYSPLIYLSTAKKAAEAIELAKSGKNPEEIELDEFETCDAYCKFHTKTLYKKPEDEKELDELEHKDELLELYQERQKIALELSELTNRKKEIEERIKAIMSEENAKKIVDLGITFVESVRKSIDSKSLKAAHPDIYAKFLKESVTQSLRFSKGA